MTVSDRCWHNRVKTLAGKAHLNSFEMVELFKTEQSHMEPSILQLAAGETVRSKGQAGRERKKEYRGYRTNLMEEIIP